ncbi:hypothetical protein J2755_000754 [Methanohalophilus levihalophilus]|nr:hypothetical protein [Methanohalophilus levihalophilus]
MQKISDVGLLRFKIRRKLGTHFQKHAIARVTTKGIIKCVLHSTITIKSGKIKFNDGTT